MAEWLGRDLSELDLVVLMIDGVFIEEPCCSSHSASPATARSTCSVSARARRKTRRVAPRCSPICATAACTPIVLAVIDGSKALAMAIRDVFGGRALIQRCQAHKARNVLDQLPEDMRPSVRQALRDAYGSADASRARRDYSPTSCAGSATRTPAPRLPSKRASTRRSR